MERVAITVRMNESASRAANPHVPWSPEEVAADAAACAEAGAAVVHFHGREETTGATDHGANTLSRTVDLVNHACDAVTYCTLGAGSGMDREARAATLTDATSVPELAPVDLGSFNLDPYDPTTRSFITEEGLYVNTVGTVRHLLETIVGRGVTPVAVAWSVGSLRLLAALVEQGTWPAPVIGELVVSDRLLVAHPASPDGIEGLFRFLPDVPASWSLMCAMGSVLPLVGPAVAAASGARASLGAQTDVELGFGFGLGDHPYPELGAPDNAEVVHAVVEELARHDCRPATPAEVRGHLHRGA